MTKLYVVERYNRDPKDIRKRKHPWADPHVWWEEIAFWDGPLRGALVKFSDDNKRGTLHHRRRPHCQS